MATSPESEQNALNMADVFGHLGAAETTCDISLSAKKIMISNYLLTLAYLNIFQFLSNMIIHLSARLVNKSSFLGLKQILWGKCGSLAASCVYLLCVLSREHTVGPLCKEEGR